MLRLPQISCDSNEMDRNPRRERWISRKSARARALSCEGMLSGWSATNVSIVFSSCITWCLSWWLFGLAHHSERFPLSRVQWGKNTDFTRTTTHMHAHTQKRIHSYWFFNVISIVLIGFVATTHYDCHSFPFPQPSDGNNNIILCISIRHFTVISRRSFRPLAGVVWCVAHNAISGDGHLRRA